MLYSTEVVEFVNRFVTKKPTRIPSLYPTEYALLVLETGFLPVDARPSQRMYYVRNNVTETHCIVCSKLVYKWNASIKAPPRWCSSKCKNNDQLVQQHRNENLVKKYGSKDLFYRSFKTPKKIKPQGVGALERLRRSQQGLIDKFGETSYKLSTLDPLIRSKLKSHIYMRFFHVDRQLNMTQMAAMLGVNITTVSAWLDRHNIVKRRYQGLRSAQECEIVEEIKRWYNDTIITSAKILSCNREVDILLPDDSIAIEYCGLYWHNDTHNRITPLYHANKMKECQTLGVRLVTIFEDEWLHNPKLVIQKLKRILKCDKSDSIYARNTSVITEVDKKHKGIFYKENHIQGNDKSTHTLGLIFNGTYVAMMSFIKRGTIWELSRYASARSIPGGFSKLLYHFEKYFLPKVVISFADLRWSVGNLYSTNGFSLVHTAKPTYYYVRGTTRLHRSNFMKDKIKKNYPHVFDPALTESEMTNKLQLPKIWDCGKLKYEKRYTRD